MAFQYDAQGRPLNPLTGRPMDVGGSTQTSRADETTIPGGATATGSTPPPAAAGNASYLANPDAWVQQNYGEGYSASGGPQTVMSGNGITMTHNKRTPETHPWLFAGSNQADVNGRIYGSGTTRTDTGYSAGRQASDTERRASYDANNYFRNGGKGLDPRLMQGMTRTNPLSNQYRNQYGTYNQQHAIIDPARKAAGLDPWVEKRSSFQGRDQQGQDVNYSNMSSVWGNRGPGLQNPRLSGGLGQSGALSQALRNPAVGGNPQSSAGGQSLGGGGFSSGNSYIGLPDQQFGSQSRTSGVPDWWAQMQQRMPGKAPGV